MAKIRPLIDIKKVDHKLISESFCDKPHDFYLAYNKDADELIIRLMEPKGFTSLYFLDDIHALIVDLDKMEVVGMELFNFASEYIVNKKELNEVWETQHLADELVRYQKVHYTPKNQRVAAPPQSLIYSALFNNACKEINTMMA